MKQKKIIKGTKTVIVHIDSVATWLNYKILGGAQLLLIAIVDSRRSFSVDISVHLAGKNAQATVVGIVRARDGANIQFHTMQHHGAVGTTSNLLVKSVLSGVSKFTYAGSICVDPIAQKTDAYQRNENLLLDSTCRAESEPALEILANDVRCTHGATIGTIDKEELWYLGTRGIAEDEARKMIATGFLQSAFSLIPDAVIREKIESQCVLP